MAERIPAPSDDTRRRRAGPIRRAFRRFFGHWLIPLGRHPALGFVAALCLLITGVVELLEDVVAHFATSLEIHHGIIVVGLAQALRGLAELVEGVAWFGLEEEEQAREHRQSAEARLAEREA